MDHGEGGGRARLRPVTSKRSDLRPPGRPPEWHGEPRVPQSRACGARFFALYDGVLNPVADASATRICSTKQMRGSIGMVVKFDANFDRSMLKFCSGPH